MRCVTLLFIFKYAALTPIAALIVEEAVASESGVKVAAEVCV